MSARVAALAFAALLTLPAARACAESAVLFPPQTAGCHVGAAISAARVPPYRKSAAPMTAVRLERGYPRLALEEAQARTAEGPTDQPAGHRDLRGCRQVFGREALRQWPLRCDALLVGRVRRRQLQG